MMVGMYDLKKWTLLKIKIINRNCLNIFFRKFACHVYAQAKYDENDLENPRRVRFFMNYICLNKLMKHY